VLTFSNASDTNYPCLNGSVPSVLSSKMVLEIFANGPCSPVVLIPGIEDSRLIVEIDCHILKEQQPAVFEICGWTNCLGGLHSPKKEYLGWFPHVLSPMSIFTDDDNNKECWSGLAKTQYDVTDDSITLINSPGVKLRPAGLTPETYKKTDYDCGMDAVCDLLPDIPNPADQQYFKTIRDKLTDMGYVSGLTMQAIPYDFRVNSGNDYIKDGFSKILQNLHKLTNKKVIIIAHSMGNIRTTKYLWDMDQAIKDEVIGTYVAIAPPYLGAGEMTNFLFCGTSEFSFAFKIGLNFKVFKEAIGDFTSLYELAPTQTFQTQRDQPWMKKILSRIDYEQGKSEDPIFDWLPKREDICFTEYTNSKCSSGLYDYTDIGSMLGQPMTVNNFQSFVKEYSFSNIKGDGFKCLDKRYETLPPLGVQMVLIYSTVVDTVGGTDFIKDPRDKTDQEEFCQINEDYTYRMVKGDGTVNSASAITPAIKWADDFDNSVANAKPVKIVQMCSSKNNRMDPYDEETSDGKKMNKNEYQGIECNCSQDKVKECTHDSMLWADGVLLYLQKTLITNESVELTPDIANKSKEEIESMVDMCNILYEPFK